MLSKKPNILIVDDVKENLLAQSALLEDFDVNVITAIDGNEALAEVLKHDFALIIMDVQMPVMDGFETATIMRTQVNTPIIFVTAISVENRYIFKGYEVGAVDYMLKPIEPEILKSKVKVFLELHEQRVLLENEITERKKAEQALIQSEKLKSIGIITAGISHEYNNILNIISGNVQLLQMDYEDNSEMMAVLDITMKAIDDGASIANRMLDFTKAGKVSFNLEPADMQVLLNQSLEFTMPRWKNMAQADGIKYFIDQKDIKQVPPVMCQPSDVREMFINIINNALDAMPDGGSITLAIWSKENTLFVSISDTGIGMDKEIQSHIFDPFYTTRCPEGTGLGLSTVYGTMKRHGGKIDVKSEVGRGSTFTMQFQTTTEAIRADIPKKADKSKSRNMGLSILVVDDADDMCVILDTFLSKEGHKVRTVNKGAEAIELANRENFDLVLTDLAMSNTYGYDVINALKKLDKVPKIGIMTGWNEKHKPIEEEGMKADFLLNKPFKLEQITDQIQTLFGTDSK